MYKVLLLYAIVRGLILGDAMLEMLYRFAARSRPAPRELKSYQ